MHRGSSTEHSFTYRIPKQPLAQRALFHAPRMQRAERPNHVWHSVFATSAGGGRAGVIEHRVYMDDIKRLDVLIKPDRQRARIFERLSPLHRKEDCGNPFVTVSGFEFRVSSQGLEVLNWGRLTEFGSHIRSFQTRNSKLETRNWSHSVVSCGNEHLCSLLLQGTTHLDYRVSGTTRTLRD